MCMGHQYARAYLLHFYRFSLTNSASPLRTEQWWWTHMEQELKRIRNTIMMEGRTSYWLRWIIRSKHLILLWRNNLFLVLLRYILMGVGQLALFCCIIYLISHNRCFSFHPRYLLLVDDKDKQEKTRPQSVTRPSSVSTGKNFYFGGSPKGSLKNFTGCISYAYINR